MMKRTNLLKILSFGTLICSTFSCSSNSILSSNSSSNESKISSSKSSTEISSSSESNLASSSSTSLINKEDAYFDETNDVYRMNISTKDNVFPVDKETYINGTINITNQACTSTILDNAEMGIKLRGNSSFTCEKKSFKIKFDKKQSLFGLTKAKKWNLIANFYDKSNLRNYLAYKTAQKMSGLQWQVTPIFIDVYFNNEFIGLYLLTENVEVNEGRVDIENHYSKEGYSSFLVEADARVIYDYPETMLNEIYFRMANYYLVPKFPDPDDYLENKENINSLDEEISRTAYEYVTAYNENFEYLKEFFASAYDDIKDNKNYDKIDISSFIDFYLVQEFFKNVDVGSTSQFFVIDQADEEVKIKMGPVWDFDISAGVCYDAPSYAWYNELDLYVKSADSFLNQLFQIPSFKRATRKRYKEIKETFEETLTDIDKIVDKIDAALVRNEARWPIDFSSLTEWIEIYAYGEKYKTLTSTNDHIKYLKRVLKERLAVLDEAYYD